MFDWTIAVDGLAVLMLITFMTWIVSLFKHDVSIVDSVWAGFFLAAVWVWWLAPLANGPRSQACLLLVTVWAIRLSAYLTWRNHGQPEDRRYRDIRARNQPHYPLKSLFIVFALQAVLAWIIILAALPVLKSQIPWSWIDGLGVVVFLTGVGFESLADWQMAQFKKHPHSDGGVLNRGLWRYSRHPNYFGECVVWWGFYLMAVGAEAPFWLIVSPLLITFLLVKVSGVPLLEQDIAQRRPAYLDYIRRTSSFIPRPPRAGQGETP